MEVTIDVHLLIKQLYGMQIEEANKNLLNAYTLLSTNKAAACTRAEKALKYFKRARVIVNRFSYRFDKSDSLILNSLCERCEKTVNDLKNDILLGG